MREALLGRAGGGSMRAAAPVLVPLLACGPPGGKDTMPRTPVQGREAGRGLAHVYVYVHVCVCVLHSVRVGM